MAQMKTGAPAQKVTASAASAALATVIVAILSEQLPEIARFQVEFVTIITFLTGYFVPPSPTDEILEK